VFRIEHGAIALKEILFNHAVFRKWCLMEDTTW